mmetsp:Transcript_17230/g.36054  ORF Transcript_17230/g.36054 Transcript_17230/m.36054 type:complete len:503 (-) Transcript_17230:1093-2601(-)
MSNSFLFLRQLLIHQPTQHRRLDLPFLLRRHFLPSRRPHRSCDRRRRRRRWIPRTLRGDGAVAVASRRSGGGTGAGFAVHAASHGGIEGVGGFGFGSQSRRGGGGGEGVRGSMGVVAAVVERMVVGRRVGGVEFVVGEFVAEYGFEEGRSFGGVVIVIDVVIVVDVIVIVVVSGRRRKAIHQRRSQIHGEIVVSFAFFGRRRMLAPLLPQMRRGVVLRQSPRRRQQRRHHLAVDGKMGGIQVGEGGLMILRGGGGGGCRNRRILGRIRLGNVKFGQWSRTVRSVVRPVMRRGSRRSRSRSHRRPVRRPARQTVRQQPPRLLPRPSQEGLVIPLPRLFRRRGGRTGRAALVGGDGGVGSRREVRVRGGRRARRRRRGGGGRGAGEGAGDGRGSSAVAAAFDEGRVGIVVGRHGRGRGGRGGKSRGRGGRRMIEIEGEVGGEGGVRVGGAVGQQVVAAAAAAAAGEFEFGGGFAADFGRHPFLGTAAHDDDDDDGMIAGSNFSL